MARHSAQPLQNVELTEEELLAAPPRLLTREQRAKRRRLRNNVAKAKTRKRRAEARKNGIEKRVFCTAKKQNGDDCAGYAIIGLEHCSQHLTPEEREQSGIVRRPRQAGPVPLTGPQLAKDVIETAIIKILSPYFLANGLKILGIDEESGEAIVQDLGEDAGLMLHGESKDGYIHMSRYPDIVGRVQINEKMFDRVYGKPKQTQVLEGGVKPIQVEPVRTVERSQQMAKLLAHLGQGRGELPPAPGEALAEEVVESEVLEGQVVQLRHDEKGEVPE